jgi:hypothetical protein
VREEAVRKLESVHAQLVGEYTCFVHCALMHSVLIC